MPAKRATPTVYKPAVVVRTTPSDTGFFNNKDAELSDVPAK